MPARAEARIELVKLAAGERLLRVSEPLSGLALERKLDAMRSVYDQKQLLLDVFKAALKRAKLITA